MRPRSPQTFTNGATGGAGHPTASDPPTATGQYPSPVWINGNASAHPPPDINAIAIAGTSTASPAAAELDVPEPPAATGQYPGPVWATGAASPPTATPAAWRSPAALAEDAIPEPPSATGQYPGPVWTDTPATTQGLRTSAPRVAPAPGQKRPPDPPSRAVTTATGSTDSSVGSLKESDYSENLAGAIETAETAVTGDLTPLTNETIYRIVREVAVADSGDETYGAVSADREHEALGHPAQPRRHFGLGFGLVLFTQESGRLGRVLRLTQQRDPHSFAAVFGSVAEALLTTTNAATPAERLQVVDGEPLWSPAWVERFRRAGALPACQYAQNEEAIEGLFRPMLKVAAGLGIASDRGLAMLFDRVVTRGLGGGVRWVLRTVGPLTTQTQRDHALQILGYADLRQFQAATPGLPQDGVFGTDTYAELVAALRRHGGATLPSPAEYACRMMTAAVGPARDRLLRLRNSTALVDAVYQLP